MDQKGRLQSMGCTRAKGQEVPPSPVLCNSGLGEGRGVSLVKWMDLLIDMVLPGHRSHKVMQPRHHSFKNVSSYLLNSTSWDRPQSPTQRPTQSLSEALATHAY